MTYRSLTENYISLAFIYCLLMSIPIWICITNEIQLKINFGRHGKASSLHNTPMQSEDYKTLVLGTYIQAASIQEICILN